jgi:hypothetical protein
MRPRRLVLLGLATAWPLLSAPARAAQPSGKTPVRAAPDADLLEFLGSVDSDDADWHEYLENTDVERVAGRGGTAPAKPGEPARSGPPPRQQGGVSKP